MFTYHQGDGRKDSNEITSVLLTYINNSNGPLHNLVLISASCCGQNKNQTMVHFLFTLVHRFHVFKTVSYLFPVRGHSYLHNDQDLLTKRNDTLDLSNYQKSGTVLFKKQGRNHLHLVSLTCTTSTHMLYITEKYFYVSVRDTYHGPWQTCTVLKKHMPAVLNLTSLYATHPPIAPVKKNDLQQLMPFVKPENRRFYEDLISGLSNNDENEKLTNNLELALWPLFGGSSADAGTLSGSLHPDARFVCVDADLNPQCSRQGFSQLSLLLSPRGFKKPRHYFNATRALVQQILDSFYTPPCHEDTTKGENADRGRFFRILQDAVSIFTEPISFQRAMEEEGEKNKLSPVMISRKEVLSPDETVSSPPPSTLLHAPSISRESTASFWPRWISLGHMVNKSGKLPGSRQASSPEKCDDLSGTLCPENKARESAIVDPRTSRTLHKPHEKMGLVVMGTWLFVLREYVYVDALGRLDDYFTFPASLHFIRRPNASSWDTDCGTGGQTRAQTRVRSSFELTRHTKANRLVHGTCVRKTASALLLCYRRKIICAPLELSPLPRLGGVEPACRRTADDSPQSPHAALNILPLSLNKQRDVKHVPPAQELFEVTSSYL
ncbi:hypothetical protein PR048_016237 [Dryococelus australis]|uniref:DUF7869 domain-containing protein n=1 Tax=Dryococelus australis TaxID=614101 RepID=A0ABQ9HJL9_9NEOP|nr:hypothetical protein PR048_016237 [Dryococelus australis]